MDVLSDMESKYSKKRIKEFNPGDTIKVNFKIREGDKERIQVFEGIVIQRRGKGTGETFTIRKTSSGIGVERIFPVSSPYISGITIVKKGKVRRAKLFYLRKLKGKAAKIEEEKTEKTKDKEAKLNNKTTD
jgi:large subunit ribosomal protein L19